MQTSATPGLFTAKSLNSEEQFLLGWLAKEDWSLYGECRGISLDTLIRLGLVRTAHTPPVDQTGVALTEAGHALAKELRAPRLTPTQGG